MIVLHVLTGSEADIREKLIEFAPVLPMELRELRLNRVWTKVPRVVMPGYLFLDHDLNVHEYYRVKETPGVIRVLNFTDPLPDNEAEMIRNMACEMLAPHVIDGEGNVVQGFFQTEDLIAVHKRQRRAVFAVRLMNRRQTVTVSATFLQ